ncbi:MAG: 30S ribosomal protein S6 [Candidatus Paceibacterota bacterium]|jgi:ribosomal protein S6
MDNVDERKIYELGYLLVPYLPAESVAKSVEDLIKSQIESSGGEITTALEPVMTRLAYIITKVINNKHTKFSDAYFGALRFKVSSEAVKKLEANWKKDDNLIRFLLISMPKGSENIVAPKRVFARREDKPFEIERLIPDKEEEKVVLSAEELDKEIDKEIDKLVEPVA